MNRFIYLALSHDYDSYEVNLMNLKYLSLVFVSCFALSCSMVDQPLVYPVDEINRTAGLAMAKSRGVNVTVIDRHLESLMNETSLIESQVQHLMGRLQSLRDEIGIENAYEITIFETMPAVEVISEKIEPQVIVPAPERAIEKPISIAPKIVSKAAGVYKIRHGIHANKTRFVFDVNGSTKHKMAFDSEAGIATITLPDTLWSTSNSRIYKLNQLSGYEAKSSGQGTIIAMAIQNTSDVKTTILSKPNRLVVDLIK